MVWVGFFVTRALRRHRILLVMRLFRWLWFRRALALMMLVWVDLLCLLFISLFLLVSDLLRGLRRVSSRNWRSLTLPIFLTEDSLAFRRLERLVTKFLDLLCEAILIKRYFLEILPDLGIRAHWLVAAPFYVKFQILAICVEQDREAFGLVFFLVAVLVFVELHLQKGSVRNRVKLERCKVEPLP